ncbi:hypothetical protein [Nocardia cyriacigeorgica]|uniref:hypothetical protein n=1 Tax=Nocardia cyriacigeorgica TaxID=135487 RepID=UPI002453AF0E|nr:hypothetical protein [Nocardia cyriacigeorgica]
MDEFDQVMDGLHSWLVDEFGKDGLFLVDKDVNVIVAVPRVMGSPFTLTRTDDGIRVDLGLSVSLLIARDDPFSIADIQDPLSSIITTGVLLSVPVRPFGDPIIRYSIEYENGSLSSKVPGHEYVEFMINGWKLHRSAP